MQGEFALAKTSECKQLLKAGAAEKEFSRLYKQEDVTRQRERLRKSLSGFSERNGKFASSVLRGVLRSAETIPIISGEEHWPRRLIWTL